MDADEIGLWSEAIDAQDESEFLRAMSFDNLKQRFDKDVIEARKKATRESEYTLHDKLRLPVDLRRLRKKRPG